MRAAPDAEEGLRRRRRICSSRAAAARPFCAEILRSYLRRPERHVEHGPVVGMEPRHVARRHLQVEDARRAVLKHLTVVRLLVHGHDGRLPIGAADRRRRIARIAP